MENVYIVAAKRTAVTKAKRGAFAHVRPDDLLAHTIKAVCQDQPGIAPSDIGDCIVGCAMPEGEQGMNVGRMGVLLAGLPDTVPGMTINRFCASGIQSIALAAHQIACGASNVILAGGTESMSMIPMGGERLSANPKLFENEEALVGAAYGMGLTAEVVADQFQISREDQDAFSLTSHQRAVAAIEAGHFQAEIAPYKVDQTSPDLSTGEIQHREQIVDRDEGPRADTSLAALAKLKPPFKQGGTVTAGNSSQMSDGAGMALLVSESYLKQHNLTPIGRFCGFATAGVAPEIMGIGPIEAIPAVLKQTGLSLSDMDWIELNEAFAAQSLAVIRHLDLNTDIVNPLGGAIALGHPLGATGAIRLATVLHGLKRVNKRYGMVTMCIGTGMGAAAVIEAL